MTKQKESAKQRNPAALVTYTLTWDSWFHWFPFDQIVSAPDLQPGFEAHLGPVCLNAIVGVEK